MTASISLEFTGERMVPEQADASTFWEHIYRYRFAAGFVRGKRVLDIACGEGYGSAAMKKAGAASVIGVDISQETCDHARRKYGVDARVGDATAIPLPDKSVDVIVSFETIEHVPSPRQFLDECRRVLAPGGVLIISTPNRDAYRQECPNNPFHCSELSDQEFVDLLRGRFGGWKLYSQVLLSVPWWSPRGLAALAWSLQHVRGVGRMMNFIRRLTCPQVCGEVSEAQRSAAVETILAPMGFAETLANPYALRPWTSKREQPRYLVAVATR